MSIHVYIDASGDPGLLLKQGASSLYMVACIVFDTGHDVNVCNEAIEQLKAKLNWIGEFHFQENSDRIRNLVLNMMSQQNFTYYSIVIQKHFCINIFKNKSDFYELVCMSILEKLNLNFSNVELMIDQDGSSELSMHLKKCLKSKQSSIKSFKIRKSESNNLLQVADYIAGVITRSTLPKKKNDELFIKIIRKIKGAIDIWPEK